MRGVVAVVVAGSLGRGEPWPLSDIDIVPIYAEGEETDSSRELSARAEELESAWEAEGTRTDVDVGNIWFTDREAWAVVELPPARTVPLLGEFRWHHGIDKPHGGRAAWDPTGVARGFLEWVNRIRFSPAILAQAGRELSESLDQAGRNLQQGNVQQRHQLSLTSRRVVGEDVTSREDRRDVLLAFTTYAFRRDTALGHWTGLGCDHEKMVARLEVPGA